MASIIERELLRREGVDLRTIEVPLEEGSFTFWIGRIGWNEPNRIYNILSIYRDDWRISLVKNERNEAVYVHRSGELLRMIKTDVSQLDPLNQHFFALTWSSERISLYIDGQPVDSPVIERQVKPIRHRQLDASPEIEYAEIYIPDDTDLGTGRFTTVLKPDALAGRKHIASIILQVPHFQASMTINPGTRQVPVLLGRADGTEPISRKVFLIPDSVDPATTHSLVANFQDWQVLTLDLDTAPIVALSDRAAVALDTLTPADRRCIESSIIPLGDSHDRLFDSGQIKKLAGSVESFIMQVTSSMGIVFTVHDKRVEVVDILPADRLEQLKIA